MLVKFPWYGEQVCPIKIEITRDEPVILEPITRPIMHGYDEDLHVQACCYRLEEIVAEKMRSLLQSRQRLATGRWSRPRSRDYYDLWRVITDFGSELAPHVLTPLLRKKCDHRMVSYRDLEDFLSPDLIFEARTSWAGNLGPFVWGLAPFDEVPAALKQRLPLFFPGL